MLEFENEVYWMTKDWIRCLRIGIKVIKDLGSELNYWRVLNEMESKFELDACTLGFTVREALLNLWWPPWRWSKIRDGDFLMRKGQRSLHDHHHGLWCSSRLVMMPMVEPLNKTVTTKQGPPSTSPFTTSGEVHKWWKAPWGPYNLEGVEQGWAA